MQKRYRIAIILTIFFAISFFMVRQQAHLSGVSAAQALDGRDVLADAVPTVYEDIFLPLTMKNYIAERPLWRFGAAKARRAILNFDPGDMKQLRLGWYVNWTTTEEVEPYGMEYVPMVRIKQLKDDGTGSPVQCCYDCDYLEPYAYTTTPDVATMTTYAAAHPGKLWILGNEIERVDWENSDGSCGGQDEILPELYAVAYHDLYSAIKGADPTAQIAIGGVIQGTPLRLEYLTKVWDAYQTEYSQDMPVDVWNIHAFVLQEKVDEWGADIPAGSEVTEGQLYTSLDNKDFSIAQGHLIAMRQWMKDHGQQNKPLIISEYGVNFPSWIDENEFSYEDVRDEFMVPSFDFFLNYTDANLGYPADDNRLVQRWNWYSLDDDSGWYDGEDYFQGFNGNLFYSGHGEEPMGLSDLGQYWIDYVESLPKAADPPY